MCTRIHAPRCDGFATLSKAPIINILANILLKSTTIEEESDLLKGDGIHDERED